MYAKTLQHGFPNPYSLSVPLTSYKLSKSSDTAGPVVHILARFACALLGDDKYVSVTVSELGDVTRFVVGVGAENLHAMMGAEGRTAKSLGVIVRAVGIKHGLRFELVIETEPSE